MRFFREALRLQLKKTLRPPMLAMMVMFAVGLLLIGQVFRENMAIQIGLFFAEPSRAESVIAERLTAYGGDDWQIIIFESEDELRRAVRSRQIEAGYVFGKSSEPVRVYTSTATVAGRISNLFLAAVLLEGEMGEIGAGVLVPVLAPVPPEPESVLPSVSPEISGETLAANIQARAESYLADGLLMERTVIVHAPGAAHEAVSGNGASPAGAAGLTGTASLADTVMRTAIPVASAVIALFNMLQWKPPHIRKRTYTAAAVIAVVVVAVGFAVVVGLIFWATPYN